MDKVILTKVNSLYGGITGEHDFMGAILITHT